MKKIVMLAAILVAGLMFMPNVYADGWSFEDITHDAGDSLVDDEEATPLIGANKTTLTYSGKSFVMLEEGTEETDSNDRPEGYAWIGFKVTAPTDSSSGSNKLYVKVPGKDTFEEVTQDSGKSYTEYVGINEEKLKAALEAGTSLKYTFEFAMGNGSAPTETEYTVIIEIDPATTILYPVNTEMEAAKAGTATIAYNGPEEKKILDEQKAKENENTEQPKNEANPNTSDINLYLLLSLITVSGCGIAYTIKKRFN